MTSESISGENGREVTSEQPPASAAEHVAHEDATARFANDSLAVYLRKELQRAALREQRVMQRQ